VKPVPRIEEAPREALERVGAALLRHEGAAARASTAPWTFAEQLFGERVLLVERQPIRAVRGGRTFASSGAFTPMHTDSQAHFGVPASAQVLVCARPAASGGESTLVDAFDLVDDVAARDPELHDALFDERRTIPFYFGEVSGPTVVCRREHVFFTHGPAPGPGDALGERLQRHVDAAPRAVLRLEAGDILVVNNHRVLHGRLPFEDPAREMVRLLVWLEAPWDAPPAIARRVQREKTPSDPLASRRLAVVLKLLRGTPPGVLSAREKIPEAVLYRWREQALRGAADALGDDDDAQRFTS
jgi:gamma-butyrobetaine dioxygenase